MQPNTTIQDELKELNSFLAGVPVTNVYIVPEGYFSAALDDILASVSRKELVKLDKTVPEGYFEGLADSILNKIRSSEKEIQNQSSRISLNEDVSVPGYEESILLAGVKNNVFTVPPGYFDSLAENIINNLPKAAPVIQMNRAFPIFRYAVAAVVTGFLGLSIISVLNKDLPGNGQNIVMAQADKIISAGSFDQVLSTVTDDDIVHYLEMSGEDVEAALVASMTDDNTLPEVSDYFTDETALDKLLEDVIN